MCGYSTFSCTKEWPAPRHNATPIPFVAYLGGERGIRETCTSLRFISSLPAGFYAPANLSSPFPPSQLTEWLSPVASTLPLSPLYPLPPVAPPPALRHPHPHPRQVRPAPTPAWSARSKQPKQNRPPGGRCSASSRIRSSRPRLSGTTASSLSGTSSTHSQVRCRGNSSPCSRVRRALVEVRAQGGATVEEVVLDQAQPPRRVEHYRCRVACAAYSAPQYFQSFKGGRRGERSEAAHIAQA